MYSFWSTVSAISELAREVKQAKANAEASAPRISSYAFDSAKSAFESAKARHESAQAEFKRLKAQRDSAKAEFDRLQAQFKQAQAAFNRRLEEVKSERAFRKRQSVDKVNMALVKSNAHYLGTLFGQNAKVVPHGDGNVTYLRDAWQNHDDYLIDDARKRGTNTHKI